MKAPDIIYLHQTIDAKSGIEVGIEWHRGKVVDIDRVYFSEEKVREVLRYKLTKFQMDKVSIEGEGTNGKKIEMNGMVTFNLGNIDKVIDSILEELKGGKE